MKRDSASGAAGALLLAVSISAMSSTILEAQRAKVSDESGDRGKFDRAAAAYEKAKAELDGLWTPRPVPVIQAEVAAARIDMNLWRRSKECADITREESREACRPILALYKERGNAARYTELKPEVERLKATLDGLHRPEAITASESVVSGFWAWIMGLAVVSIATFGSVIFAAWKPSIRLRLMTCLQFPELPELGKRPRRRKAHAAVARPMRGSSIFRSDSGKGTVAHRAVPR